MDGSTDAGTGRSAAAATGPADERQVRVMVVDDHPMWRDAVARDLAEAGFDVVATAGDGAKALRVAPAARPTVVLLDLQLPDLSGVEVTARLLGGDRDDDGNRDAGSGARGGDDAGEPVPSPPSPAPRVLILSASGEHRDVLDAVKAGATGYLVKSAGREELLEAVRGVHRGEAVFTPGLAGLVLGEYRRLAAEPAPAEEEDPAPELTRRETEVLRLVAKGLEYKGIASRLGIAHRTVQNHVQNTLTKLQLHNRAQLVRYAIERNLDE